jgi:hypothetical protein
MQNAIAECNARERLIVTGFPLLDLSFEASTFAWRSQNPTNTAKGVSSTFLSIVSMKHFVPSPSSHIQKSFVTILPSIT